MINESKLFQTLNPSLKFLSENIKLEYGTKMICLEPSTTVASGYIVLQIKMTPGCIFW